VIFIVIRPSHNSPRRAGIAAVGGIVATVAAAHNMCHFVTIHHGVRHHPKTRSVLKSQRIIFPAANVVELQSFDLDESAIGPHDVIVKTHRTLISPGTELARLQGKLTFDTETPPEYPMDIVGYANIGTVLEAGGETRVKPGDRVYTMGNHVTIARVDARSMLCVPVPGGIADEDAVFARMATVSMTTLITTFARPGDNVAVVGLGLVGNLAAQVFQASGYRVNAFDLFPHRREIARQAEITSVHDGSAMNRFSQQHRLIIEATGSAKALASAIDMAAPSFSRSPPKRSI